MATKKPTSNEMKATVADAISGAVADLTSLGEECREVYDNMPESLQQGSRGTTMDETASTLEDVQEPEVPELLGALACTWREALPKRKGRGLSRASRRDNAVAALDAAVQAVEEWRDEFDAATEALEDGEASAEQQKLVAGLLGDKFGAAASKADALEALTAMVAGTATAEEQKLVHATFTGEDIAPDYETLISETGEIKDNADGCEFPGMYG